MGSMRATGAVLALVVLCLQLTDTLSTNVPGSGLVTLFYYTSWDPAFLHFTTDDSQWNDVPGRVLRVSSNPSYPAPEWWQVTVEAVNLTFVLTNGQGQWDNNGGRNYKLTSSGVYALKNGDITTVQLFPAAEIPRTFPSMLLNNWKDMMATWVGSRDNNNQAIPVRSGGLTSLRRADVGWDIPLLSAEGLALQLGTEGPFLTDPTGWDGPSYVTASGSFVTPLQSYYLEPLPQGISVTRTYITPPGQDFILIEYLVEGLQPSHANVSLMTYAAGAASAEGSTSASAECSSGAAGVLCTATSGPPSAASSPVMVYGSFAASPPASYSATSAAGVTSPASQYQLHGSLDNAGAVQGVATAATAITFTPAPGSTSLAAYIFVGGGTSAAAAQQVAASARSRSPQQWAAAAEQSYTAWLAKGVQPSLSETEQELYTNSLILLKNGQNPELGTIVASFHPAYLYKVWGRDGVFAAMILDAAGYHEEAAAFLSWAATAEMRPGGGFHTCYSLWTGEVVGFVEPQFDSAGAFLSAILHHFLLTGDEAFLDKVRPRAEAIQTFFLTNVKDGGFVPADYSIWEESSSGVTGLPLPTSYFTFTQSMAYSGLIAAAITNTRYWQEPATAQALTARAKLLAATVEEKVWQEDKGYYARNIWSTTLDVDITHDSSTTAVVFSGLATNRTRISSHLAAINANLTQDTHGLARFTGDIFFYDSRFDPGGDEVGAPSPPWGVVTMFMAWAEMQAGASGAPAGIVQQRIEWMVKHAAPHGMPVGEAIDGVTGQFIMTSCPDIYEYGGVYIWTVLMSQNLAWLPDPTSWPTSPQQ